MPNISHENKEQSEDHFVKHVNNIPVVGTVPVLVVGVNRKTNIGNYENIDIYAGLTIPLSPEAIENFDALRELVAEAADHGFNITSLETFKRYDAIKSAQRQPRAEEPAAD